jgi:NAD(P)-dependent dehydrogenase (short-subunit alcohol dehydrogenase family)
MKFKGENNFVNLLLDEKRAFVSGGTRGIGAALCEVFAREGADVAFNYHSRDDLAEEVKAKIEAHGRRALAFKISVTDRIGMKKVAREILDTWMPKNLRFLSTQAGSAAAIFRRFSRNWCAGNSMYRLYF